VSAHETTLPVETRLRLYQLVRQQGHVDDRTVEITFEASGVEAYVFTFG
jgi:Thioredoxin like C-terminal domain